ncbi:MAG TPA: polysaccharide biosynthesis tyrosine autokinase [Verrucomicrobiae bacterium]|nr:polysaccharide biosynthesis tyrosine autokinase [Verrucomicrobiae bacterium]
MNGQQKQLSTTAVDLFAPDASRFDSATKLYGRLHRWWLLLRKNWWAPGLIFLAVVAPVYWFTTLSGPTYESKARMWVSGKINVSESWSYTEELVNFLGTQAELLQSPTIQNRAMARLRAQSQPGSKLAGAGSASQGNFLNGAKALLKKWFAAGAVADTNAPPPVPFQVKVLEGAKSSTLELRVTGHDPVSTRKFLDCLMAEYLSFKHESRDQASTQASSSLSDGGARLKGEVAAAQEKLQAFQASNNVALLQQQGSGAESYLASLNHQLAILRTEQQLLASLKPEQWVQSGIPTTRADPSAGNEAAARQMLSGLTESQTTLFQADQQMHVLMAKRAHLLRFLRPAHPKIIRFDQDIATQQEIVQAARDEAAKQLASRREAVQLQITNLEAACVEWNGKAIETTRKVAEYNQLQQNAQRLQAAYDKTFGLIQNLDVANRVEQENFGILDPASAARPTHRLLANLSIATVVSLLLGLGLLYGLSLFQDNFASEAELVGHLAERVVGQVPHISIKYHDTAPGIEEMEKERFEFMEAFRNIRASLLLMNNGGPKPKTIVVTSSVPEEGKSTVALYLAATLARGNSRVLLVDADLRRPSLHKKFGLAPGPGLAEMLDGELTSADLTFPEGIENLAFLPAGEARRNPGDLALSPVWAQFLASVEWQFDFILLDTPPVAATDEAAVLAPKVDGVLFVVRALSTSARVARSALDMLRERQSRMLGLIFNQVVSSPCERQYYQPYAREYQWQPAPNKAVGQLPPGPAEPEAGMGNHYLGLRHPNGGITRDQALGTQSDQQ